MNLKQVESKEIRKFGFIAFVFFGSLCSVGIWLKKSIPIYFFGFLFMLGVGFVIAPSKLKPVYSFWQKNAYIIGKILTILILTVAYYLVITPAALLKRVFGGRPLPIKPDKNIETYWATHIELAKTEKDRFIKRY